MKFKVPGIIPTRHTVIMDYDGSICKALELAEKVHTEEVTCFLNGNPGFRTSTTKEQEAIYILARAVVALAYGEDER